MPFIAELWILKAVYFEARYRILLFKAFRIRPDSDTQDWFTGTPVLDYVVKLIWMLEKS